MPFTPITTALAQAVFVTTAGAPLTSEGETLATFDAELDGLWGDRDDVDATRRKKWLNMAYRHVCASVDIQELNASVAINTVDSQPFYLLPKQVSFIKRLAISDDENYSLDEGRELQLIDLSSYRKQSVVDDQTPLMYFRYGRRILVLYPDPDAVYALAMDWKVRPDDLVLDTDSPLIPQEWHEAILCRARYVGWRALRVYKEAAIAQNDYVMAVRPMLDTDAEERAAMEAHFSPAREVRDTYRNRGR